MPRTRPAARRPAAPRSPDARPVDPARLEALAKEIESRLSTRAFSFEDPASYRAGVRESAAALRRALQRSEPRSGSR